MEIKHHFLRDHVQKRVIALEFVFVEKQLADTFTTPFCKQKFSKI